MKIVFYFYLFLYDKIYIRQKNLKYPSKHNKYVTFWNEINPSERDQEHVWTLQYILNWAGSRCLDSSDFENNIQNPLDQSNKDKVL